ncbi:MAG: type II secretion system protein [Candidatus Scatovivens sp.]
MRSKKGITLIALVITIVVILILAGISINVIVNGDFFGKANTVKEDYASSVEQSEIHENKALEQNQQDFKVDDEYAVSGIIIKYYDDNDKKFEPITCSLSKYIDEKRYGC